MCVCVRVCVCFASPPHLPLHACKCGCETHRSQSDGCVCNLELAELLLRSLSPPVLGQCDGSELQRGKLLLLRKPAEHGLDARGYPVSLLLKLALDGKQRLGVTARTTLTQQQQQ